MADESKSAMPQAAAPSQADDAVMQIDELKERIAELQRELACREEAAAQDRPCDAGDPFVSADAEPALEPVPAPEPTPVPAPEPAPVPAPVSEPVPAPAPAPAPAPMFAGVQAAPMPAGCGAPVPPAGYHPPVSQPQPQPVADPQPAAPQSPVPQQPASQPVMPQQPYASAAYAHTQPVAPVPPAYPQVPHGAPHSYAHSKDHVAAGLLGIFLGVFGIHKFYLGYNTAGFIMLGVALLGSILTFGLAASVVWLIGLIEGIIYLVKNQSEFEQIYVVHKREWF